ncbi:MAG: radical SAM protein [Candidatus Pacearchaeota archaeon]
MIPESVKQKLEKMQYRIVGNHSAVQICRWTKNALRGEGVCWKEKFYGIKTIGCCQMTPSVMWCENLCLHCWRPIEMNLGTDIGEIDSPKEILDGIIKERIKLLEGFGGNKKVNQKLLKEAKEPKLFTMSLSGEPTLYPKLGELFKEIRKRNAVSFLVTNGQNPLAIKKLEKDGLPTQITVSLNAPNKELFQKWHNSTKKNAWEEFLKTLDLVNSLEGKVRRVIRLTLVKKGKGDTPRLNEITNMSQENLKEYALLIKKANPDFIHIKGFKSVGYSRDRMGYDKQPWFKEVKSYSKQLLNELKDENYKIGAEDNASCVVMLAKKGKKLKIRKQDY